MCCLIFLSLLTIEVLVFLFSPNRWSDDYYFLYGCLYSGPQTLFVSNDSMGNHSEGMPPHLRRIFTQWLSSRQVKCERELIVSVKWWTTRVNYRNSHYMYIRSLLSAQLTPLRWRLPQKTVATCKCKRQREQLAATSFQKATASD